MRLPALTADVLRPAIRVRLSRQDMDGWHRTSASIGVAHLDGRQLLRPFGQQCNPITATCMTLYSDVSGPKPMPAELESACADNLIDDVTRWFADADYRMARERSAMERANEPPDNEYDPWDESTLGPWPLHYTESDIVIACERLRYAVFMGVLA